MSIGFWNSVALEAVARENEAQEFAAKQRLSIVEAAIYDAVGCVLPAIGPPYLFRKIAPAGASQDYAVCGAAFTTLMALYPAQSAFFEARLEAFQGCFPTEMPDFEPLGFNLGCEIGRAMLSLCANELENLPQLNPLFAPDYELQRIPFSSHYPLPAFSATS